MTRVWEELHFDFNFTPKEVTCFVVAALLHSLLFLWKGGMLTLPNQEGGVLGESLVTIGYMSEMPSYPEPGAPGKEGAKPKKSVMQKMKSFFSAPKEELALSVGQEKTIEVHRISDGEAVKAKPNLQEKIFKVAPKDVKFDIVRAKDIDNLDNVNMVPVTVGATTDKTVKSLAAPGSGGVPGGAALKSKTFAPRASSSEFGLAGGKGTSQGTETIATGTGLIGTGSGGGGNLAGATGSGLGGKGGRGSGAGSGVGFGTGFGTGVGSGMMARRTIEDNEPAVTSSASKDSGYNITGALSKRPIISKSLPPYEMDARVALRFRVDWSGRVLDGIIVEISSGSPSFDQKVMAHLKNWIFSKLPTEQAHQIQEGVISFVFRGF